MKYVVNVIHEDGVTGGRALFDKPKDARKHYDAISEFLKDTGIKITKEIIKEQQTYR